VFVLSNLEDYKVAGYLEWRELVERVANNHRGGSKLQIRTSLRRWIANAREVRGIFIAHGLLVLPKDRKFLGVWSPNAELALTAYYRWMMRQRAAKRRMSAIRAASFVKSFLDGEQWTLEFLPMPLRPIPKDDETNIYRPVTILSSRRKAAIA
jgi:hypothetical protein